MKFISQIILLFSLAAGVSLHAYGSSAEKSLGPQEAVEQAANRIITVLKEEGDGVADDPDKVYALVDTHVLPHFDFDRMSYFVLGQVWKSATDKQKEDFQEQFKQLLINTYTTALSEYSTDGEILYTGVKISPKNEDIAIVQTEIRQKGRGPVAVSYRMYRTEGLWRIYDVSIGGVSLVTNYRANFAGSVRSQGLDGLISTLMDHNKPKSDTATVKPASTVQ